jgi:CBS domain-containing protein
VALNDTFRTLPSLVEIAESSLTVRQLAATELTYVSGSMSVVDAAELLSTNKFDAAPIAAARPGLYVDYTDLTGRTGIVSEHARPLDATRLVSTTLSLADGVRLLSRLPYYFVLEGDDLAGIVTRADLQRQAVAIVLLGFILGSEIAMNIVIRDRLGSEWIDGLGEEAAAEVELLYQARVQANAEISPLDCLMLHHRLALLGKAPGVCSDLGYESKRGFASWAKSLTRLRDTLAHGGGLLHALADPVEAIELFDDVRLFAERVWGVADAGSPR